MKSQPQRCYHNPKDVIDKHAEVGLRHLLNSMNQEGNLKRGKFFARVQLQIRLQNHAHVISSTTAKDNMKPRQDPVFICGFHRTGVIHSFLSAAVRSLNLKHFHLILRYHLSA